MLRVKKEVQPSLPSFDFYFFHLIFLSDGFFHEKFFSRIFCENGVARGGYFTDGWVGCIFCERNFYFELLMRRKLISRQYLKNDLKFTEKEINFLFNWKQGITPRLKTKANYLRFFLDKPVLEDLFHPQ